MSRPPRIPDELIGQVFTTAQAKQAGVSASMLRGPHFTQVHRGVWRVAATEMTLERRIDAARLLLPADTPISHLTALHWMGVTIGRQTPVHFSTNSDRQIGSDVVLHRRLGRLSVTAERGVPTLGPDRSFVDSATILGLRHLVRVGDQLVRLGRTTPDRLVEYCMRSHLDGVVRARDAALLVRPRVDSPRETDVRLVIVAAGLPEPETNVEVIDDDGTWVARGDLVYRDHRLIIEHDGWHHERDADQRQKDHHRRERIEAAGWTVLVVTAADFANPFSIVGRVFRALRRAGHDGPPPSVADPLWPRVTRNL